MEAKQYKLLIKVNNSFLNYTAVDFYEHDNHFSFTDKYGLKLEFHKDCLIQKEEVWGGNQ